ncbi:hypothetical protein GE09DRAFT_1213751 [Coniochaeta sp. 2T2.1]|nr:hypothetical protein GE09DRAFT_1213751 [Coniochaeta sp. 2T2.1]
MDGWHLPAADRSKGQTVSDLDFDSLIYGQEGAAPPPRGVTVDPQKALKRPPPRKQPVPPDELFYAHIDPRVHWPQVHSDEWYEKKMQEIQARGGRKANFGKAAERMREQTLREEAISWEDSLPEKIRQNPAWVRALRELRKQQEQPQKNSPRKRGKPGPKPKGLKRETFGPKTPRKSIGLTYRQMRRQEGLDSSDSEYQ